MPRFLIDEDVDQKALRTIPSNDKGFEVLFPERANIKGSTDIFARRKALSDNRVFVTGDFEDEIATDLIAAYPHGLIVIIPPRHAQKRVGELWQRFCKLVVETFPRDPYNFNAKIIEIREDRITIVTETQQISREYARLPR